MTTPDTEPTDADHDVAVVGGGPAGATAALFCGRYDLDTVVFDRGRSSIARCAHLENFPGFPAGIDVETFYGLVHDQVRESGAELVEKSVDAVEEIDGMSGFQLTTADGGATSARRVVAATRYDGSYLRPLDDDTMFETVAHDGEEQDRFDRSYADHDGTTPIDGLYVASPSDAADRQAVVAAGRGARVGLTVLESVRVDRGYPPAVAKPWDWLRRDATLDAEWNDRDHWREWADGRRPDDHALDDDRWEDLREREIDRRLATYLTDDEIETRTRRAQDRLLDHVDDDRILARAEQIESEHQPTEVSE